MTSKERMQVAVSGAKDELIELSHRIHAHPELAFAEEQAASWLADALTRAGFEVELGCYDLPTAFVASIGSGPLHVAICAEYDALPEIGHACGHNIIAAAAVGAGIAARNLVDELGLTLQVIGTPAEEIGDGGGKILLLERGAFDGVHAALMVHPSPLSLDLAAPSLTALATFGVEYRGHEANVTVPYAGINAADAMVIAQTSIGLLRQQLPPDQRVFGFVTKGGDGLGVIPAHTTAQFGVQAPSLDVLQELRKRVQRCFEAGALATGATLTMHGGDKPYTESRWDGELASLYQTNAESLGRKFMEPSTRGGGPSSDMGNISFALPAIHPMIGISSLPARNHHAEFTAHCVTDAADQAVIDGATAMAWTIADLATEPLIRERLLKR